MKIPITMCHGLTERLTLERFLQYLEIASELGFSSINYDQLYAWLTGAGTLPKRPILFDFDHPMLSIPAEIFPLMQDYGFTGNLFVNTGYFGKICEEAAKKAGKPVCATWEHIDRLRQAGWTIGAHTHTHPNLSELAMTDLSGERVRAEMEENDRIIQEDLGFAPRYFAFTGNDRGGTWSTVAEREAQKRYRLARLWILGGHCEADGRRIRLRTFFAGLVSWPTPCRGRVFGLGTASAPWPGTTIAISNFITPFRAAAPYAIPSTRACFRNRSSTSSTTRRIRCYLSIPRLCPWWRALKTSFRVCGRSLC